MPPLNILIIDDDRNFSLSLRDYLEGKKHQVEVANTGTEGLAMVKKKWFHIALLDENLPDAKGHELCPELLKNHSELKIIFITAHPSFDHALKAIRSGAYDYLSKPFELGELDIALANAARTLELEQESEIGRYTASQDQAGSNLVWKSPAMARLMEDVKMAVDSLSPALITGETGTGKNVLARYIHEQSKRRSGPFIVINCSAIPESLAETELFGHEKGAFTGAGRAKKGVFELASGGTLVLDEIGDMPPLLQTRLLTVLDDRSVRRVGGETPIPIDVRLIATTNVDLEKAVTAKNFRADLYYRISVIRFVVPPLRQRPEDLPMLASNFIKKYNRAGAELDPQETKALLRYNWPGNIRELRNIIERSVLLNKTGRFSPSQLISPASMNESKTIANVVDEQADQPLEAIEHRYILSMLSKYGGNKSRAAKALGISLSSLKRKVKDD